MKSFKYWLQEDSSGKSLNSAGQDVNPVSTATAAQDAFKLYAADKSHADDLVGLRNVSGTDSIRKAITNLTPDIASFSTIPVSNQKFTAPDIGKIVAQNYFPNQKLFMNKLMRKMMLKKMEKK